MALLFGFLLAFELSFVACNEMLQLPQLQLIAHKLNEQYEILQKQLMQQNLLEAKYEDLQKQLVQQKRLEAKFEELERQNNQMKDFQIQMEQKHNTLQQQLLEKDILLMAHVKQMEEMYSELNSRLLLKDKQILSLEEQMKRFESRFKSTEEHNMELVHSKAVEMSNPFFRLPPTQKEAEKANNYTSEQNSYKMNTNFSYYENDEDQAFKWNHAIRMSKVGGENEFFLKC